MVVFVHMKSLVLLNQKQSAMSLKFQGGGGGGVSVTKGQKYLVVWTRGATAVT